MPTPLIDVPNLDGLSVDPKDYESAAIVYDLLARYCRLKCLAVESRIDGMTNQAIDCEKYCDQIYKQLPEWAKW